MASVWIQTVGGPEPAKLHGGLSLEAAQAQLAQMVRLYVQQKAGRKATRVSSLDALLFDSKGRIFANVYVEPLSPPTQPEPGELRRSVTNGRP